MTYTRLQLTRLFTNLALLFCPTGESYLRGQLELDRDFAKQRAYVVLRGLDKVKTR